MRSTVPQLDSASKPPREHDESTVPQDPSQRSWLSMSKDFISNKLLGDFHDRSNWRTMFQKEAYEVLWTIPQRYGLMWWDSKKTNSTPPTNMSKSGLFYTGLCISGETLKTRQSSKKGPFIKQFSRIGRWWGKKGCKWNLKKK